MVAPLENGEFQLGLSDVREAGLAVPVEVYGPEDTAPRHAPLV